MGFFGVDTWDQVLALFQRGGALEGQWAWLKVLHMASEGDALQIYHYWSGVSWTPVEILGIPFGAVTKGKEPPALFMLFEGHFRISEAGELYISGVRSWNHPCELSIFEAGQMGNSYAVSAHNTYSGRYYEQRTSNPGGARWMRVGAAWPGGGYPDRWTIAPDWDRIAADVVGLAADAAGPAFWWISGLATGYNVHGYLPELRRGDRGTQIDLFLDLVGTAPGPIGIIANLWSLGRDLNVRNLH